MTRIWLALVVTMATMVLASSGEQFQSDSAFLTKEVKRDEIDTADRVTKEEMDDIGRKVDSMNDEELSTIIDAVLPHPNRRYRRTLGTVRRCIEKVRCLFGGLKRKRQLKEAAAAAAAAAESNSRRKRASSPAAILRAISKLTGLASNAANELGNRFGLSGASDFSLGNLFRDTPSSGSSSSSSASLSAAAADDEDASLTESDDSNLAEASEVVQETVCDQQCQLSVLVYRRLRRLLRRL